MEDQVNVPVHQRLDLDQIVGHDTDSDAYSRVPISNFGLNMLKSMGWQEGKGIGKNPQNALPKPIEFVPNYERAGLGARKELPSHLKKRRLNDQAAQAQVDENGRIRHRVEIGGASQKPKKVERNSKVTIIDGKYKDLKGVVTDINESKKECYVELEINEKLVKVDLSKVKLQEVEQEEDYVVDFERGETSEGDYQREKSDRGSSLSSTKGEKKSKKDEKKKKKKKDKREKRSLKWIATNIWVKVISKKVRDGKLYEKKVYVTDILDEYSFSALDEKGNMVDELREKDVQTVMPKQNGLVKILVGENKGKVAVMMERDKKRNKIMVQLVETMEVEEYTQDDCSMYEEKM